MVQKAIDMNLEDLVRRNVFQTWMDLLAVCVCKSESVAEAVNLFEQLRLQNAHNNFFQQQRKAKDHFLLQLIKLYAQEEEITVQKVEDILISSPAPIAFVFAAVFNLAYKGGNIKTIASLNSLQERMTYQFCLMQRECNKEFNFMLLTAKDRAEEYDKIVKSRYVNQSILGHVEEKKLDDDVEGDVDCLDFLE